jgi:hypothetical protein
LLGRLDGGLTPWRRHRLGASAWPRARMWSIWTERRREPHDWLSAFEIALRRRGHVVLRGGAWDAWDLHVRTGVLGSVRLLMAHEEHGRGRQLVRLRLWPRATTACWIGVGGLVALAALAGVAGAGFATAVLASLATVVGVRTLADCSLATAAVRDVVEYTERAERALKRAPVPTVNLGAKEAA